MSIDDAKGAGNEELKSLSLERPDYAKRYRPLEINPAIQQKGIIGLNDTLNMELFPGEEYKAIIEKVTEINGLPTYRAKISGFKHAWAFISSDNGKSLITIEVPEKDKVFRIEYKRGNQKHLLIEVDKTKRNYIEESPSVIPPADNEEEKNGTEKGDPVKLKSAASEKKTDADLAFMSGDDGPVTINLLIVYTPAAAIWAANSEGGINNTIASVMNKAQLALDNSNTNITLNLVYSAEVNYTEQHSNNDLYNLRNKYDGYMDEVHSWRDAYAADVVVLLEETGFTGGLGYLLMNENGSASYAFSLTRVQQASWTYTVIHEIGHNMGADHHKDQNYQSGPGLFSYSAGGRWTGTNNGNYCSVMTYQSGEYFEDGISHSRVPFFSDPNIIYQGVPTGDAVDADNARTLREIKNVVAGYREDTTTPTDFNAVASGESQIDLSWNLNDGNPILIAWSDSPEIGNPVNGETYSQGDPIPGGGTVLYYGSGSSYQHTNLAQGITCYYKAWSDLSGTYSPSVSANATTWCTAISEFPYSEQFESEMQPPCWTVTDNARTGQIWTFNNPGGKTLNSSSAANGFAIIDSDNYGSDGEQNSDLISPVFDFSEFTGISIQFEHFYNHYTGSSATFSYTTNGGDTWFEIQSWTSSTSNAVTFSEDLSGVLEGESQVRFKWNYTGSWGWYWAIDDIRITAEQITSQVPDNQNITSAILTTGTTDCFNATNTITVAGDGDVIVQTGASANFIAGQSIRFLPGFHAQSGSYVIGQITTTGDYCVEAAPALVAAETTSEKEAVIVNAGLTEVAGREMVVYPNPNNGEFTVEFRNFENEIRVMLFNSIGQLVQDERTTDQEIRMSVPNLKSGVYFIKAVNRGEQFNRKIVVR